MDTMIKFNRNNRNYAPQSFTLPKGEFVVTPSADTYGFQRPTVIYANSFAEAAEIFGKAQIDIANNATEADHKALGFTTKKRIGASPDAHDFENLEDFRQAYQVWARNLIPMGELCEDGNSRETVKVMGRWGEGVSESEITIVYERPRGWVESVRVTSEADCARCARLLHADSSIEVGVGPVCERHLKAVA